MDRAVIDEKLEALRRCVQRVKSKCPESADQLMQDVDLQDIIAINLARAVQISVDIATRILAETQESAPNTMAGAFESLKNAGILDADVTVRMKKAVGFRNIAVHAYEKIDWAIVYSICRQRLEDFEHFARSVLKAVNEL